jgi:hypothetical protein
MVHFIVNESKDGYDKEVADILNLKEKDILKFFNKSTRINFNVFLYSNKERLIDSLKQRGLGEFPSYMCACSPDGDDSINLYEPSVDDMWSKYDYANIIFHESIHYIEYALYGHHPKWLSEGIAKYLDGTYSKGIKWLLDNYIKNYELPSDINLVRDNQFVTDKYDGYDLSYIAVSYLIDTLGKDNFIKNLDSNDKINAMSEDIINKAVNYYKDLFANNSNLC